MPYKPISRKGRFGFTVSRYKKDDTWAVFLPHQCDTWTVAGKDYAGCGGIDHSDVVEGLKAFIEEATEALGYLLEEKELAGGDGDGPYESRYEYDRREK